MGVDYSCLLCGWSLGGNQNSDKHRMVPPFLFKLLHMKKYVPALLLIFCVTLLIGCQNREKERVEEGRKMYRAFFKKQLRNPNSFVVYNEEYKYEEKDYTYTVYWKLDVGMDDIDGFNHRVKGECETSLFGLKINLAGKTHHVTYSELQPYME